jgi:hypothetical protein
MCNNHTIAYTFDKPIAANLPRHGPERERRDLTTTTHVQYGGPYSVNSARKPTSELARTGNEMMSAGTHTIPKPPPAWKSQTKAIGEDFRIDPNADPKANTHVQRSWRYNMEVDQVPYNRDFSDTSDPNKNLPGLGFKGLGDNNYSRPGSRNLARPNDSYSDKLGIWRG